MNLNDRPAPPPNNQAPLNRHERRKAKALATPPPIPTGAVGVPPNPLTLERLYAAMATHGAASYRISVHPENGPLLNEMLDASVITMGQDGAVHVKDEETP